MKCFLHIVWGFLLISICGCQKVNNPEAPEQTQAINNYLLDLMEEAYLWEEHIPADADPVHSFDTFEFFESLCYRQEDPWTYLTDEADTFLDAKVGVSTTFGYNLAYGKFSNTGNYFAIVCYVYPNTVASEAGLQRGSLILRINDKDMTYDDLSQLTTAETLSLTLGRYTGQGISASGTVQLTARKQNVNPVVATNFISDGTHRVGYLCYANFFKDTQDAFYQVFKEFQVKHITDLVVDLRYNPGGNVETARHLAGAIAPATCLNGATVLFSYRWNDFYQSYWTQHNRDDQLHINFPDAASLAVNLDLKRVYFLTGQNSASASEFVICGLDPYMEVTCIGDTTYGKYAVAGVFVPEEKSIANWAAQMIICKYANANGVTDFVNGFAPDYKVEDVLIASEVYALGDPREPLFSKALQLIGVSTAGSLSASTKASTNDPAYPLLPTPPFAIRATDYELTMPLDKSIFN